MNLFLKAKYDTDKLEKKISDAEKIPNISGPCLKNEIIMLKLLK